AGGAFTLRPEDEFPVLPAILLGFVLVALLGMLIVRHSQRR
ncbi:MAG: hypothetical protein RLZZ122_312, partial [Actinomycetota bacterium]